MNIAISTASELALRKQVERAVRPVHATEQRKLQMREELLGHLTSIFVEEYKQLGDETAALTKSQSRFGDPAELTAELNRSVGQGQQIAWIVEQGEHRLDKCFGKQKHESLLRYAVRHLLMITVLTVGMMAMICGIIWSIGGPPDAATRFMLVRLFPLMIVCNWTILVAAACVDSSLATGVRRWALLLLQSGAWSLILTAVMAGFWWSISDRPMSFGQIARVGAEISAVVGGMMVFIIFVVDFARVIRQRREAWTLLEIDE